MNESSENEYQAWQEDVEYLANTLKQLFEADRTRYYLDELNNRLYIEIDGLGDFDQEEVAEIAEPVLTELDLDFEDIILLPFNE
jgi:hypothetical protein